MTTRDLTPELKRIKKAVLEGKRGDALAKYLAIPKTTVYNRIAQLVYMGELIDITGNPKTTPRIYEDGRKNPPYSKKSELENEQTQTDEKEPENKEFSKRVVPSSTIKDKSGRPSKVVRFHCTGCWDVPVIVLGDHSGRIADRQGYTIGSWSDMKISNGSRRQYGTVRLYPNEDLKFTLFHAKEGPKLTVTPNPRDVYYKTASKEGPILLADQVYNLLDLLTDVHNWQFGQPVYKGVNHYALTSEELAPLLKFADRQTDPDNARVHVDTSEGSPEIEIYDDHEGAQEDTITLYELPQQLDALKAGLSEVYGILRIVVSSVGELTKTTAELTKNQAQIITTVAEAKIKEFDGVGYQ